MSYTIVCKVCKRRAECDCQLADLPDTCPDCRRRREEPEQDPVQRLIMFQVRFTPVAQPRPRAGATPIGPACPVCKRRPTRAVIREADDDHAIHLYKLRVLDAWRLVKPAPGWHFTGPVAVQAEVVVPRPKEKRKNPTAGRWRPTVGSAINGDCDNYVKALLDALNGNAWRDDAQVCRLIVDKFVAGTNEEPHTTVTLAELPVVDGEYATAQAKLFD